MIIIKQKINFNHNLKNYLMYKKQIILYKVNQVNIEITILFKQVILLKYYNNEQKKLENNLSNLTA